MAFGCWWSSTMLTWSFPVIRLAGVGINPFAIAEDDLVASTDSMSAHVNNTSLRSACPETTSRRSLKNRLGGGDGFQS